MRGLAPKNQPPQRDPIFRDAKFFCFGAINNRRNDWLGIPFCCHIGWVFTRVHRRSQGLQTPYIKHSMVLCVCYKYFYQLRTE